MTRIDSILFVLSSLLAAECAAAQADARSSFERNVLDSANGELKANDFAILGPRLVKGDGTVDSVVELCFAPREGRSFRARPEFFAAVIHNIELDPPKGDGVWRLRRARFERADDDGSTWFAKELIFGCRHEGDDGDGAVVPLPRTRRAINHFLCEVVVKERAGVRWRSVNVDMTGDRLQLTAEVEVRGDGFRKRFLAVETALADGCKDPDGPFVEARWLGDEKLAADKQGASFTLELQPRRQLEPKVQRRGK